MKILILGANGMLGSAMFRLMSQQHELNVYGTIRKPNVIKYFSPDLSSKLRVGVDIDKIDSLTQVIEEIKPQIIVNCIGLIKQLEEANQPLKCIAINSLLPHQLAAICGAINTRLIHISTDCVFSGTKGNYLETDFPDADDLYGRTKLLGEVVNYPHAITLRTSIIGHELEGQKSLIGWFLAQQGAVKGFSRAVFSGLPTVELSKVIIEQILPRPKMQGLYHVAAEAIDKYNLLKIVKEIYNKNIDVISSSELTIDRSLNAEHFNKVTGYVPPKWQELVQRMHEFK